MAPYKMILLAISLTFMLSLGTQAQDPEAAPIPPSSVGPTSKEEADILWKEAQRLCDQQKYAEAILPLRRIIDRYPGYAAYLPAHLLLGRAYRETEHPQKAIGPLNDFISGAGTSTDGLAARLVLSETYLDLKKPSEALLSSVEVEKAAPSDQKDLLLGAEVLKTRAILHLKRIGYEKEAEKTLASAEKYLSPSSPMEWRGKYALTRLELKNQQCALLPSAGKLTEAEVRDQIDRRGTCTLEALNRFHDAIQIDYRPTLLRSTSAMIQALDQYQQACGYPSLPPEKRTKLELKNYLSELKLRLKEDCQAKLNEARSALESWRSNSPNPEIQKVLEKAFHG